MTIEQIAKQKSASVTLGILNAESRKPLWLGIPGIVEAAAGAASLAERILECSRTQAARGGEAESKSAAKETMVNSAFLAACSLKAFASATREPAVFAQVAASRTELARGRETEAANRCQAILDLGRTHAAVLAAKYNTSAADLTALEAAIKTFSQAQPKPRQGQAASSAATQELVDLFADLDEVLRNQLDPLLEKFRTTQPAFYNEYQAARVVIEAAATRETTDDAATPATGTGTNAVPRDGASLTIAPAVAGESSRETVKAA